MIGYIYHITNTVNDKKYIGKTVNIKRRISEHFLHLEKGDHHSIKLQKAYNKYGKDVFEISYKEVLVENSEELDLLEIKEIEEYNSFKNGYNMTLGGEGGILALDFHSSVLAYNILKRYSGVQRLLGRYFGCSKEVFASLAENDIFNNIKYSEEELQSLILKLGLTEANLKANYIPHNSQKLDRQKCFEILSIISKTEGYDKTLCEIFGINSKMTYRLRRKMIYKEYIEEFEKLSEEDKEKLHKETLEKYDLEHKRAERQRKGVKNPLTQEQVNYILDNKNKKPGTAIAKDLGVSVDRVRGIINGKSYKDLINNYYSSIG